MTDKYIPRRLCKCHKCRKYKYCFLRGTHYYCLECHCNHRHILATMPGEAFRPDEEPYESDVIEDCGYEVLPVHEMISIHWCPTCSKIIDIWFEG